MNLLDMLRNLNKQERLLLRSLVGQEIDHSVIIENHHVFTEIFCGAHMVVYDDGKLYKNLKEQFPHLRGRTSSHKSNQIQYSIYEKNIRECIFSTRNLTKSEKLAHPDIQSLTWVQFERNNTNTLWDIINHIIDYLIYRYTGKNVGPLGLSSYTDNNPYILDDIEFQPSTSNQLGSCEI